MKKINKIIAALTALLMFQGTMMLPETNTFKNNITVGALSEQYYDDENSVIIYYEKSEDHIVITDAESSIPFPIRNLVIPETIKGLPVTEIADMDEYGLYAENYVLPDTIKRIGNNVFRGKSFSDVLNEFVMPADLEEIGDFAFFDSNVHKISLNSKLKKIGTGAFAKNYISDIELDKNNKYFKLVDNNLYNYDMTELIMTDSVSEITEFKVPDTVKKIDYKAINYYSIDKLILPEGLEELGESCLSAYIIKELTIPSTLKTIGKFNISPDIVSKINVSTDNPVFKIINGVLYNVKDKELFYVPSDIDTENFTVEEGTETIGDRAFQSCKNVKKVILPDSVTVIEDAAFNAAHISQINFPENLEYIGETAFCSSEIGGDIVLPDSVKFIGDSAFSSLPDLISIYIPDSVENIFEHTFSYDENLDTVYLNSKYDLNLIEVNENTKFEFNDYKGTVEIDGVLFSSDKKNLITFPKDLIADKYVIPAGVETISSYAFSNTQVKQVIIPESVKEIRSNAFISSMIENADVPSTVTYIGDNAFKLCQNLYFAEMPEETDYFGKNVFSGCCELVSVKLPENLEEIPEGTFTDCKMLKSLSLPAGIKHLKKCSLPKNINEIFITVNTSEIDDDAFEECVDLVNISGEEFSEAETFAEKHNYQFYPDLHSRKADVNEDSKLDIKDMIMMKNALLTEKYPEENYDVDRNGSVDASDLVSLQKALMGLRDENIRGLRDAVFMRFDIEYPLADKVYEMLNTDDYLNSVASAEEIQMRKSKNSIKAGLLGQKLNDIAGEKVKELFDNNYSVTIGFKNVQNFNTTQIYPDYTSLIYDNALNVYIDERAYAYDSKNNGVVYIAAVPEEVCDPLKLTATVSAREIYVAKPVIYLYPEEETKVNVKLELDRDSHLAYSYPEYPEETGWNVTAKPDSTIYDENGREYSYLFWDAVSDKKWDTSEGFVVKGSDTVKFLQEKLEYLGLTPKEYNEFIVYWMPKMQNNKYNLITFQTKDYEESAKLEITPKPDSIQRVFMTFKPLDEYTEVKEQKLEPFERHGFSVIEWGGAELQ